jgi:hypothetical protein
MEEDRDDIWQNYCRDSGACVRTNLGCWLRSRSRRPTGKEANGIRGKPIVQAKPSSPMGCKLVGTVKGTKFGLATVLMHQNLEGLRLRKKSHRRHHPSPLPPKRNNRG